jgi:MFS family permease
MTQVAAIWLVYQLTDSAFMLGLAGFIAQIPSFVLAPFGGVIVDRWNHRNLLVVTQLLAMMQSLALATLALAGNISIWSIFGLSFFQGLINAVDAPARQTFVRDLIERPDDLASAIALNSSLINGAKLIGPAIAGIVIAQIGAGYCFLIDGMSYIAVIAGLLAMRFKPKPQAIVATNVLRRIQEGFIYVYEFAPIRAILMLMTMFSLMASPYATIVPIFATKILRGDAHTLGFLMAASGIGALSGAIYMSTRKTVLGLGKIVASAPFIYGTGLIAFALSRAVWLSVLAIAMVGLGAMLQIASSNTIIQTIVDDDKRGRVMSIYTMSFLGMAPFGNLLLGSLASHIGAPDTLMMSGGVCMVGSIVFAKQLPALRRLVRPIYIREGILPPANET